jgi:hypothetical protein
LATSDRRNLARLSIAGALAVCAAYAGCTVESHTFVDDSLFNLDSGTGNVGNGGAQGGTGGTGAGGSGGGPGGSGGTGSGTGNENCTNGQDDDNDSQIDCADSDCQPLYACVPPVPAGWQGPVAFYEGTDAAPLCNASGGFPTQKQSANSGIVPGTATCPTCECNLTGTPVCAANLVYTTDSACQGGSCWGDSAFCPGTANLALNGTCFSIGMCHLNGGADKSSSLEVTEIKPTGTCTSASTGTADIPEPGWTNEVRACGDAPTTGKGCGTDGACMPVPTSPFSNSACIYKTGDTSCPSPFSNKHVVHQDTQDTRSCTGCACGALAGGSCSGGSLTTFTGANCTADPQVAALNGACNALTVDPTPTGPQAGCSNLPADTRTALLSGATIQGTPACPPSGGQISGAATAVNPITFCCL